MIEDSQLLHFYISLTPRQREVLRLASEGLSNQEIAGQLYIATSVVAGHLTNIYGLLTNLVAADERVRRYTLLRLYAGFFERYPTL